MDLHSMLNPLAPTDVPTPPCLDSPSSSHKRPLSVDTQNSTTSQFPAANKKVKLAKKRTEPPIWARKWTPDWRERLNLNGHVLTKTPIPAHAAPPPLIPDSSTEMQKTYNDVEPADEIARIVMDRVYVECKRYSESALFELEIEAKVGIIIDRQTDTRLRLPALSECVLDDSGLNIAFKSGITNEHFRFMNDHFNKACGVSNGALPIPGTTEKRRAAHPIEYSHPKETDRFYKLPRNYFEVPAFPEYIRRMVAQSRNKPKVRITTDNKTNQITAKIYKVKVGDLHVYCPRTAFDWRLSINLEVAWSGNMEELVADDEENMQGGREKDRLSYKHQGIQIDLTEVTTYENGRQEKDYELEFELGTKTLREEVTKFDKQQPNRFEGLVKNFVDDIRIATRQLKM